MIYCIGKKTVICAAALIIAAAAAFGCTFSDDFATVFAGSSTREVPIYSVDRDDKKIALTFDAAWGADKTEGILEILDDYGVKGTFFLVGFWIDKYPDEVKAIAESGCEIGNHSENHLQMSTLSREKIAEELSSREAVSRDGARLRRQRALLRQAQICTIDSFCVSLLRENAALLGLEPGFGVCDEQRAAVLKALALETVLERAYERAEPDFIALADSVGAGRDDARLEQLLLTLHGKLQAHSRPERWADAQKRDFDDLPDDAAGTVWGAELIASAKAQLG